MSARTILLVFALSNLGCRSEPTPEEYCRKRDEAWARAFPELAKDDPIGADDGSCADLVRKEQADEPALWKRRVECLRKHIRDGQEGKAARDAYLAMTACERGER